MIGWRRALLWFVLAIPAALMIQRIASGEALAMDLYHPSGEMSVRLMILALLPGPLTDALGPNRFLRGWLAIRRNLGVAAFLYALLHLGFYVLDMQLLSAMVGELPIPGIWTGWLAFALLLVPAAISFNAAMRRLGRRWKQIQRLVYPAFVLALIHWLLLDWAWGPALVHLAPLLVAWTLRMAMRRRTIVTRSIA
ncbi:MAG: ferric reductase-like transmembrane domain-containing protein [Erythrobacter sp.]|uniref:ferric reductase-like transmembrane domain-containing protein n=1 Tax=Qipengyuania citrea TaxID=225971 RepID=UPI001A48D46A|nr:ferric reductase-like transmembrane domain-containing protein [Erythrobacter sp.]MCP2018758.1 sulfoxide reductase heme-binding subunit YedZ [Qipengyuania citrea]MDE0902509.1 ferric reductase-like transmembrane domain-containing protein [Erythrobacter sp.]